MPADDVGLDVDVDVELEEVLLEPDMLDVFALFALLVFLLHAAPNMSRPSAKARITGLSLFNILLTDSFCIIFYPFS